MGDGSVINPKLIRYPVVPLAYENRDQGIPKEFIVDYTNYVLYVKNSNGELVNFITEAIHDISSDSINIIDTDGSTITLTTLANRIAVEKADRVYKAYSGTIVQIPKTDESDIDDLSILTKMKITKATPGSPASPDNVQTLTYPVVPFDFYVSGKNLVRNNVTLPITLYGITLSYDPNTGIYTLNGTSTAECSINFYNDSNTYAYKYKSGSIRHLSIWRLGGTNNTTINFHHNYRPVGGSQANHLVSLGAADNYVAVSRTAPTDEEACLFTMYIPTTGTVINNLQFKVQCEVGATPSTWEIPANSTPIVGNVLLKDTLNTQLVPKAIPSIIAADDTVTEYAFQDTVVRGSDDKWYFKKNTQDKTPTVVTSFLSVYTSTNCACFSVGMDYDTGSSFGTCNRFKLDGTVVMSTTTTDEAFSVGGTAPFYRSIYFKVKKSRLTGWSDALTDAQKIALFNTWLTANSTTVTAGLWIPTFTLLCDADQLALNIISRTFNGVTNLWLANWLVTMIINYNLIRGHVGSGFRHLTPTQKAIVDKMSAPFTTAQETAMATLTAGGNSAQHYHTTDRDRANHTGTQTSSTISDLAATVRGIALTGLILTTNAAITATDTVLSALGKIQKQFTDHLADNIKHITATERTNWNAVFANNHAHANSTVLNNTTASYTTAEQTKLGNIAAGAEVNVQSDWNAASGDAQILNKPTTIAGYGITDAYTKTEVDVKVSAVYKFKGTVATYADLPSAGLTAGDVYNVTTDPIRGDDKNYSWTGTAWDSIGGIEALATATNNGLMSKEDFSALVTLKSGGDTTQHYHATDRNRANHTGTQLAATISDFAAASRIVVLTGLVTTTNAAITATDTVLVALGKIQKQITDHLADNTKHITAAERTAWNAADALINQDVQTTASPSFVKVTTTNGVVAGSFEIVYNATTNSLDFNYLG